MICRGKLTDAELQTIAALQSELTQVKGRLEGAARMILGTRKLDPTQHYIDGDSIFANPQPNDPPAATATDTTESQ